MTLATVRVEWHGQHPVAGLEGEIDVSNVDEIAGELRDMLDNRSSRLIVDLSPTRYLDSAGINLLFALGADLRARQLELVLVVVPSSPIARMLAITSLDRTHPTFPDVDSALAAQA
jgi:anti-sigma B factor antagonist